ncbi:MAG: restriction endonuclease subunit S, partial [Chloroflexi bacterium]|nr:restriction endonuclease subunit S [Chloroflexota bacterium]
EVRFPEFEGEWVEVRLGDVFSERKERGFADLSLLSVTEAGIVNRDELDRRDTSNEDKSNYLRICPGDIGYNTMRMWQGRSALSQAEGIVSPAYTILIPASAIDAQFMAYLFKFPPMIHKFWSYSQGLVDDTLSLKFPNFSIIKIDLPQLEEQQAIADLLAISDHEMETLSTYLQTLKTQKKGLMQRLLTGEIRVLVD